MNEFRFYPLKEFEWRIEYEDGTDFLVGQYIPGMSYNCTRFPKHDALRVKCAEWEKQGMIKIKLLGKDEIFKQVKIGE